MASSGLGRWRTIVMGSLKSGEKEYMAFAQQFGTAKDYAE
jgi:hypothetical protein